MQRAKYIRNVSDTEATVLLHGTFGREISGSDFANAMRYLEEIGIKKCHVRMNSGGGDVIHAYSAFSAIHNSSMYVICYNDGICASAMGWVWLAGNEAIMADYAIFMMHNASGEGDPAVIQKFTDSISKILSNKTKKPINTITDWMSKETWMDSSDCMNEGICDKVYKTTKKPSLVGNDVQKLYAVCNSFLSNYEIKNDKMSKVASILKLSNEASEEAIAAEVGKVIDKSDSLESENADLKKKNEELEAKVAAFENSAKEEQKLRATELVENAITSKKIEESAKASWLAIANASYEDAKSALDALKAKPAHASVLNGLGTPKNDERAEWTHLDWQKKDPKGLAKLKAEDPEKERELFNNFYNKK